MAPKYISPSAVKVYERDKEEFYLRYIAKNRPPRPQQTQPMSIGSSFDAYVKTYLMERLGHKQSFEDLFEAQVEPHNRDWAREHGKYVFDFYKSQGGCTRLLGILENAIEINFESKVQGEVNGIPILGIPDLCFITKEGIPFIHDWKVNGYCSKSNTSPNKGYILMNPGGKIHKDADIFYEYGIAMSCTYMEELSRDWAIQEAMYLWVLGNKPGTQMFASIDQIVNKGGPNGDLRLAHFISEIGTKFQRELIGLIGEIWEYANCHYDEELENYHKAFSPTAKPEWEKWHNENFTR